MTITYVPKNNKKTINVEGYGEFTVRPYGAGEELQIRANMRELNEAQEQAKALLETYKGKERTEKISDEDQKTLANIQNKVDELIIETHEILKGTITSKTKSAVDKLFRELDRAEIRNIVDMALIGEVKQDDNKEANASV